MEGHSTSLPCGNSVDGLPHACYTEPHQIGSPRHPRTSVNFVIAFVFLTDFYIMVTNFDILTLEISYWSFILCDHQLPSSIKLRLLTTAFVFQNDEKMMEILKQSENFKDLHFHLEITPLWRIIDNDTSATRSIKSLLII